VRGPGAFRRAKWLRGSYKQHKHRTGKVIRAEQSGLTVRRPVEGGKRHDLPSVTRAHAPR
jgi:hypothetical protein